MAAEQGLLSALASQFLVHQLQGLGRHGLVHGQHRLNQHAGGTAHLLVGAPVGGLQGQALGHPLACQRHALVVVQNMRRQPLGEEGKQVVKHRLERSLTLLQRHHVIKKLAMRLQVLVHPGVAAQVLLPNAFFRLKVVVGVVDQFGQNALNGGLVGALYMLLGQPVDQLNQFAVLLINQCNARFKVRVPGEDFEHERYRQINSGRQGTPCSLPSPTR